MTDLDKFEKLMLELRQEEPYLPDDGFTAGVMARLPATRGIALWKKNAILLGFTAMGSGLATVYLPVDMLLSFNPGSLLSLPVLGGVGMAMFVLTGFIAWMAQAEIL